MIHKRSGWASLPLLASGESNRTRKEQAIEYTVKAKRYGSKVEFTIDADSPKDALSQARAEATKLFDYKGTGDEPTVEVKEVRLKEKE